MYSKEEREAICIKVIEGVSAGSSLRKVCKQDGMPSEGTIRLWTVDDAEFSAQYARAREARAEARTDEIDDIVDSVRTGAIGPNEARVMIDAHKWQAGKENPKRYGDKLTLDGDMNLKIPDDQLESRVALLLRKAGAAVAAGGEGTSEEAA